MRRYITETIQEKTPVLVVGEDTRFRRKIIKNISDLYADFEGIGLGNKPMETLGLTMAPQAVVWVVGDLGQLNAEDAKIRELVEEFAPQLVIILPHDLQQQASVDERFPKSVVLTVPALDPVEDGINACIHEFLGKTSVSPGVIDVKFPEQKKVEPRTAELQAKPRIEPPLKKPQLESEQAEPAKENIKRRQPMPSQPLEPPQHMRDARSVEERAAELQSAWESASIVQPPPPFSAGVQLPNAGAIAGGIHIGFDRRFVEPELPKILEPPPPMFSHLPSEHDVVTHSSALLSQYARHEVQLAPRAATPQVSEKHENILANLFAHDGKYPEQPKQSKEVASSQGANAKQTKKERRKGRARTLLVRLTMFFAALLVAGGAIAYFLQSFSTSFNTFQSMVLTDNSDPDKLKNATQSLSQQLGVVGVIDRAVQPVANLIGLGQYAESLDQQYSVAQLEVTTSQSLQQYSASLAQVYASVMGKGNADTAGAVSDAGVAADKANKQVEILSAELAKDADNSDIQNTAAESPGYSKLLSLRRDLLGIQHVFAQLPAMFGQNGKKTYLVLIQNPLELRPTGGFISAYALVTFDKGKLLDDQVQDSYVADDQLQGQVTPPADLQKFLAEKQWYFRDSNWDASFPQSAQQAAWFMQKELGVNVDGVIGMNMYSLQSLMRVTGPVQLADYGNEIVTADNLFERVMTKSELTFSVNGEQKKKEYLTSVADAVFEKLKTLDNTGAQKFSASLMQSLASSDILVSLNDANSQQVLEALGWNGEIMTPPCPQQFVGNTCFVDTVYEVDTNVGVNRANYYVRKTVTHSVLLTPQAAVHTYTMHFTDTAVSSAWPSGPYKNYVRLYVPDYAQINSVVVNNKPVSPTELTQFDEGNKKAVGFYVETPVGGSSEATVNYSTILSGESAFSYAVFTQKQPGIEPYPLSFSLHVQPPLIVKTLAPSGTITGNVIQIDSTVDKPQYMAVELGK